MLQGYYSGHGLVNNYTLTGWLQFWTGWLFGLFVCSVCLLFGQTLSVCVCRGGSGGGGGGGGGELPILKFIENEYDEKWSRLTETQSNTD